MKTKESQSQDQITHVLVKFVRENFMVQAAESAIDLDASLVLSGMIDSTGFLELIVFIEKNWLIKIPLEETIPSNFGSIRKISIYLFRKLNQSDRKK